MVQPGFFDLENRYAGLNTHGDPLVAINAAVPFELFWVKLKTALIKVGLRRADADRKSPAGLKLWDEVLIFKVLGLEDAVPDAKTLWLYREALAKAGAVEKLFDLFDGYLRARGYLAMGGQIIDATIAPAPRRRNSRDDNAKVKAGEAPEEWEKCPAKNRQKDKDARWTKKHGRSHFGYKNHVCIDRRHKLVRRYGVTSASVHDSQALDDLLDPDNTASTVWADSAYRSKEAEEKLAARGFKSRIHRRGCRGKPLTARQEAANKTRSSVRARVEHGFGSQHTSMGGKLVRTIGIVRAKTKIGMQNLAYNMRRLVVLERGTLTPA